MNYQEALKVFDLQQRPELDVLFALHKALYKIAFANNDQDRCQALNVARDVLRDGSHAEKSSFRSNDGEMSASGAVRGVCRETAHSLTMNWVHHRDEVCGDRIIIEEAKMFGVRDHFTNFLGKLRKTEHLISPAGSEISARIMFKANACPHCGSEHFHWCEHCQTIFCRRDRDAYEHDFYTCPGCGADYGWGQSYPQKARTVLKSSEIGSLEHLQKRNHLAHQPRALLTARS